MSILAESKVLANCLAIEGAKQANNIDPSLGIPQRQLSHRLKILLETSLVPGERDGNSAWYSLAIGFSDRPGFKRSIPAVD